MKKLIFNEDPNHFIISRYRSGYKNISIKDCEDFILQYKNTNITDFMICVNASIPWYNTKSNDNIISQYKEWQQSGKLTDNDKYIGLLVEFYEKHGKVPQDIWIETLRKIGIRPWTSIRMNDIHESNKDDSILFSEFYRQNRYKNRVSHRKATSYYEYGLDYMYEEVRKHYLSIIADALERFDTDGLELDWMREIYSIGIGREYEGISVINAFMSEVFNLVKSFEKKRGHQISIAVRLPDTPQKALRLGFDVFNWVENNMIDLITVTPRWSSSDNDMPIDIWKKIFKDKPVIIAAGLEILIDAYNRSGRKYEWNTYETAVASACACLWQGADAIYLFNYMDSICDNDRAEFCSGEAGRKFFTTVGNYNRCVKEKRRHIVTYNDVYAVGVAGKKQLPATVFTSNFKAIRLVTGDIPFGRRVSIILGIEAKDGFDADRLDVFLSTRKCRYWEERAPFAQQYNDLRYFVFEATNNGELPPVSIIEIGGAECTVHWVEIEVA